MNISNVKNFHNIGKFVLCNNPKQRIDVEYNHPYCRWGNKDLQNINSFVYLFTSNNDIIKIGKSECKSGVKSCINFYTCALTGDPGINRYAMHILLAEELEKGNSIDIYIKQNNPIKVNMEGLFSLYNNVECNPSALIFENLCKKDYYNINGKYPKYNFQENGEEYPIGIRKMYAGYGLERSEIKNNYHE